MLENCVNMGRLKLLSFVFSCVIGGEENVAGREAGPLDSSSSSDGMLLE